MYKAVLSCQIAKRIRQGGVSTLPIYREREQHGKGREAGDKGTGSGRAGYGRREVLTALSPPLVTDKASHLPQLSYFFLFCCL